MSYFMTVSGRVSDLKGLEPMEFVSAKEALEDQIRRGTDLSVPISKEPIQCLLKTPLSKR